MIILKGYFVGNLSPDAAYKPNSCEMCYTRNLFDRWKWIVPRQDGKFPGRKSFWGQKLLQNPIIHGKSVAFPNTALFWEAMAGPAVEMKHLIKIWCNCNREVGVPLNPFPLLVNECKIPTLLRWDMEMLRAAWKAARSQCGSLEVSTRKQRPWTGEVLLGLPPPEQWASGSQGSQRRGSLTIIHSTWFQSACGKILQLQHQSSVLIGWMDPGAAQEECWNQ